MAKHQIAQYLAKLDNIVNVDIISGPYDIVAELISENMEDLKESIQTNIKNNDKSISTLTLIRSEDI
ncbi:MAG: Lrp/AsnC ligand binding domain-containing protein [Nitrososphaeraceae archaeon]|nr:Lrp/AsnC ligand binding domain-containing protein [Nitrososphaeraceae archaeon]